MRYNHRGYQHQARAHAKLTGQDQDRDERAAQRARELRAENIRRAKAAAK